MTRFTSFGLRSEVMTNLISSKLLFQKLLFTGILIFGLTSDVRAQSSSDNSSPLIPNSIKEAPSPVGPEAEMLHRAAIRRQEEAHLEMVERAKENTRLGFQLAASVGKVVSPHADEIKKLDRMEKLARKIRGDSGGSEDDNALQNLPGDVAASIRLLAETSENLLKEVEKTSRHVISATVIKRSNEVIHLVRHVKSFVRR
ncbi:MAG TPA: hypothetical protein VF240_11915 [Pyrinomonadaceae bacterium]